MDVAGDDLVVGVTDADQRAADLFISVAYGFQERPVRRSLQSFLH